MSYDSGLDPDDIRIPGVDTTRLPATSDGDLSEADLEGAIDDAEVDVWAEVKRRGLDVSDLTSEGERAADRVVKTYAALRAQERLGHSGDVLDDAKEAYDRAWQAFRIYLHELSGATSGKIWDDTDDDPDDLAIGKDRNNIF